MKKKGKKVFVGLSGGVDSSVSAALLKELGYDVTGVFIKVWSPDWLPCTWKEERRDAMRVAAHLDIPFVTLNLEKEYKKEVVDYMVAEYRAGRVPNPDVMCNKSIKFGAFFDWAMKNGADFIATGHYARLITQPTTNPKYHSEADYGAGNQQPTTKLLKGVDESKDQTYFLWTLTQKQLTRTLFPIGGYNKPYVRALAEKFNLPTAQKKDSQGLCFVGAVDMKEFLMHFIDTRRGDVLNSEGKRIGYHDGAVFYTAGQRHGFTVTDKEEDSTPYYVIGKNVTANTITVSHRGETKKSLPKEVYIEGVHWICNEPEEGRRYGAVLRYHAKPVSCFVHTREGKTKVVFQKSSRAVAGQSLVLYDGNVCLGGGIIR